MSRSNPTENAVHPCTRWLEWHGSKGHLEYYDKAAKAKVVVGDDFTFIVLDQLSTVKGWHDATESGLCANEVKNTRTDRLTVKSFKGDGRPLVEGLYAQIKDRVDSLGGYYVAMVYVAYEEAGEMRIGVMAFNGAALSAWMDFQKAHRSEILSKAIHLNGSKTGKKGSITFKVPQFEVEDISPEANEQATALDKQLQEYFRGYFAKTSDTPKRHDPNETYEPDGASNDPEAGEPDWHPED